MCTVHRFILAVREGAWLIGVVVLSAVFCWAAQHHRAAQFCLMSIMSALSPGCFIIIVIIVFFFWTESGKGRWWGSGVFFLSVFLSFFFFYPPLSFSILASKEKREDDAWLVMLPRDSTTVHFVSLSPHLGQRLDVVDAAAAAAKKWAHFRRIVHILRLH